MLTRLVLSLVLCHVSVLAVSSAVVADPADPLNDKVDAVKVDDSKYEYDLSLNYLENKVWDAIIVTDDLGIKGHMAPLEDGLFMKALERLGRKVHRASIEDKNFDWRAGKSVILRSAWGKVRLKKKPEVERKWERMHYEFLTTHSHTH